jgi:hypothetical protein
MTALTFLPIPSLPLRSGAQINGGRTNLPRGASPGAPRQAPEPLALEVGEDVAPQYDPVFVARLVGRVVDEAQAKIRKISCWGKPAYRNPDIFRSEDALDPLRGRDDFRLLMLDLAFPAEAFARSE